jgi:hypothetical protein
MPVAGEAHRTDSLAVDRPNQDRLRIVAGSVRPIGKVRRSFIVQIANKKANTSRDSRTCLAIRVVRIAIGEFEVPRFYGEIDVGLQSRPGDDIVTVGRTEFRMEIVGCRLARVQIRMGEPIFRARNHVPSRSDRDIIDFCDQAVGRVADDNHQLVSRVHQQGVRVGSVGGDVLRARRWGTRWNSIGLEEREVDRLLAVPVAEAVIVATLLAVDRERCAPMGLIATDFIDPWRPTRRIKLQFQKRRPCVGGQSFSRVFIAVRNARILRVREGVADGQAEPNSRRQFKPRHRTARLRRHRIRAGKCHAVHHVVPRARNVRVKLHGGLVVPDIPAVVVKALAVQAVRIGTGQRLSMILVKKQRVRSVMEQVRWPVGNHMVYGTSIRDQWGNLGWHLCFIPTNRSDRSEKLFRDISMSSGGMVPCWSLTLFLPAGGFRKAKNRVLVEAGAVIATDCPRTERNVTALCSVPSPVSRLPKRDTEPTAIGQLGGLT